MGFQVLMATNVKVDVYRRFRGAFCLHYQADGRLLPDYTAQKPRMQPSSREVLFTRCQAIDYQEQLSATGLEESGV
jgi:hypothetical protein